MKTQLPHIIYTGQSSSFLTSAASRPAEARIKEHKYNLTQGLLEKSKLANMHIKKATKYVRKKRRSCSLNQTPPT
jgi:hypothetical protein